MYSFIETYFLTNENPYGRSLLLRRHTYVYIHVKLSISDLVVYTCTFVAYYVWVEFFFYFSLSDIFNLSTVFIFQGKLCMVTLIAVAVGLLFLGMSLTIAGYISAEGNDALKIGGPTVLALGVLLLIACVVQCCVRTEQYKNTLDDESDYNGSRK